jgi:hypothetical protein
MCPPAQTGTSDWADVFPGWGVPDHAGPDVELAVEFGDRLLSCQDALDRRPLELRAKDSPPVRLPWMIAHGPSSRI